MFDNDEFDRWMAQASYFEISPAGLFV